MNCAPKPISTLSCEDSTALRALAVHQMLAMHLPLKPLASPMQAAGLYSYTPFPQASQYTHIPEWSPSSPCLYVTLPTEPKAGKSGHLSAPGSQEGWHSAHLAFSTPIVKYVLSFSLGLIMCGIIQTEREFVH